LVFTLVALVGFHPSNRLGRSLVLCSGQDEAAHGVQIIEDEGAEPPLGLSERAYKRYERRKSLPHSLIAKFCAIVGVSNDDISGWSPFKQRHWS
jgi:hypothetical protein